MEDWNHKKILLSAANILCALYILYLVFHPVSKDNGDWPSSTPSTTTSSVPSSSQPAEQQQTPSEGGGDGSPPSPPSAVVTPLPRRSPPAPTAGKDVKYQTHARAVPTGATWDKYVTFGKTMFSTEFPSDEALSISSDEMVWKRQQRVFESLTCFGEDDLDKPGVPRYDVSFLPIGCFGDMPGPSCLSTSCYFARSLANATFCGKKKFGAFLGDNFYPNGLKKENDPRFDRDLNAKFFRHGALRMRYYAMVGNHDKRPTTQLRREGQHPFWYMPAFNYTGDVIKSGQTTVQTFVIDTHWGFDLNYAHMKDQAEWLDRELAASTATWKIVMSHEPIFCFADFDHSRSLLDFIHPLLIKHKVQLFVAAHVHGVFLHKVEGGYHQLTSAGFADNFHTHVKAKRPRGYYHLGRGAAAVFFTPEYADVVAFMPDASMIFSHRIPVKINPKVELTDVALGDDKLFTSRHACEALLPEVPKFCSEYASGGVAATPVTAP